MSVIENTKISLVYAIYKYNLEAYYLVITSEVNNQAVTLQVLDLKAFYKELAVDLVFFTKRIISYYNAYYSIKPIFKERDKVYLIQRNIQTKQPSTKLDHKKLGLFKIKRVIGPVNYKLVLPKTMNIYLVFYISFLELVNPNTEYKIKEILDHKQVRNYIKYLVK
jgi:hypothetical protein